MALPESRLARLERRAPRRLTMEERILEAERKCDEGTASLAQMRLVLGDLPERFLEETIVPLAPVLVAMDQAQIPFYSFESIVAYPPGAQLPEEVVNTFEFVSFQATYTAKDKKAYYALDSSWRYTLNPERRLEAATIVLGLGWPDASRARARIWVATDAGWKLDDSVHEAAKLDGLTVRQIDHLLHVGVCEIERRLLRGELGAMHKIDSKWPSSSTISYAEIAAAIPRFGWSFHRKGGQNRSDPVSEEAERSVQRS